MVQGERRLEGSCVILHRHKPLLIAEGLQLKRVFAPGYSPALRLAKAAAEKPSGEQPAAIGDGELD